MDQSLGVSTVPVPYCLRQQALGVVNDVVKTVKSIVSETGLIASPLPLISNAHKSY